jgi:hypothetical protein
MIGKCDFVLITDKNNPKNKWVTLRCNYVEDKRMYRSLVSFVEFQAKLKSYPKEALVEMVEKLFNTNPPLGQRCSRLATDVITKLDICTYKEISYLLQITGYKYNKVKKELIKIKKA